MRPGRSQPMSRITSDSSIPTHQLPRLHAVEPDPATRFSFLVNGRHITTASLKWSLQMRKGRSLGPFLKRRLNKNPIYSLRRAAKPNPNKPRPSIAAVVPPSGTLVLGTPNHEMWEMFLSSLIVTSSGPPINLWLPSTS